MWKTALLLILTILVLPVIAFMIDTPPDMMQKSVLHGLIIIYLVAALSCFLVSTLAKNYSQVDKLWSIMPLVYAWFIAWRSGFEARPLLMAILVSIWGIRLSYNFARRGGYSLKFWEGDEDYRWPVLRSRPELSAPWKWMIFNLLFISLYQMGLILLFTLPSLKSVGGSPLSWPDYLLSALFLAFVIIETIADQQQWKYQKEKHQLVALGKDLPDKYAKGFLHTGLWSIVRHPNYASEQAIWIIFYLFSVTATGMVLNWSIIGCLLLILLFLGSSDFSETISSEKYQAYEEYKKKVPRFLPYKFKGTL